MSRSENKMKITFNKKEDKIDFKGIKSEDIGANIIRNEEYRKEGYTEIEKRGDETIKEKICEIFSLISVMSLFFLVMGLIYLGTIPTYFNVDDVIIGGYNYTNVTDGLNYTRGLNQSLSAVGGFLSESVIMRLYNTGKDNAKTFFWLFWVLVFFVFIYPIIKLIWFLFKKWNKKERETKI